MKTALIAGSTGLIGEQLLQLLLDSQEYHRVISLTRTPMSLKHDKLVNIVTDFKDLGKLGSGLQADDVFCCLGTTIAKVGTKAKFRQVDHDYPVALAKAALAAGAKQYLLVSALGADAKSSIFYNHVKGDTEQAISALPFTTIHFFRPSLLLGNRNEKRTGEDLAKVFYKIFWFLIPAKYRAIESSKVSTAMLHYAQAGQQGIFVHESRELQSF